MEITVLSVPLAWPPKDTPPLQELCHDWHGKALCPAACFALVEDPTHLWLLAARQAPAKAHPTGDCGDFQKELWRHDVAELFIAEPAGERYLEFNLSPRGAWWMAAFAAARVPSPLNDLPAVRTEAICEESDKEAAMGGWEAGLAIPLDWLTKHIAWGEDSRANVSFILESPQQRFLSAWDLGGGEPDFHRPRNFAKLSRI